MCAILGLYHVLFKLSGRHRDSGRSRPEKWILGEILLLFAPGHTSKLILAASGGRLEVGVAFSTAQSAESVGSLSRTFKNYQCRQWFQRTGLVQNATPTSRGPPEAVRMSLGVCPGANSKRISPRIHFSGPELPETRSLTLSFKSTCHVIRIAHIYEFA